MCIFKHHEQLKLEMAQKPVTVKKKTQNRENLIRLLESKLRKLIMPAQYTKSKTQLLLVHLSRCEILQETKCETRL
jgi:hypothetical protein